MSSPELVTVTIDDIEIQVPKGLGLVEAALYAGVEIPVFCYEPRLGPPVGACRMCLCEVAPGPPKPQAACTLTAADGMTVRTAATSAMAAEAQDATLEFILVNHPLDCPVCDKGGECPLQDLTFRYGPGNTRMEFPKRTFEKPIPISPTIALDRERCILCYRCTRFSEDVAEDGQLVARNRGAGSIIATFEDEPYRAPFSGNVIELCPVGALTSTQYRFEARPWEIQNVPSVCGLCPVGCNISATTREGKVKRILSRNHPEIDEGWLCDKGRFGFSHLYAQDRVREPLRKTGKRRFEEIAWDDALDEAERMLRSGPALLALSGSETVEQAEALSKLVRQGLGSNAVVLPEQTSPALDAFRAPLSSIRDADLVVVLGDEPVEERAPVVGLWIKAARRKGAEVITVGVAGTVQAEPGAAAEVVRDQLGKRIKAAKRAVLIWSGPGGQGGAVIAELASKLKASAAFYLPATPNGRAVAEAWAAAGKGRPTQPDEIGVLVISGEEAVSDPRIRELARRARAVLAITMFSEPARGFADLVLPGTSYLERDGTMVNLEGRPQRLRRTVIPPAPDEIAWIAKLAERFGVEIDPHARVAEPEEHAPLPPRPQTAEPAVVKAPPKPPRGAGLRLLGYRSLFSGPVVERVEEIQFQRPEPVIELSAYDAEIRHIASGDTIVVKSNGTAIALRAMVSKALMDGVVRAAEEHVRDLGQRVEVKETVVTEPWWIGAIKAIVIVNVLLISMAFLTLLERKLLARMQRRYGPNRAGPKGILQPFADLVKMVRKEAFAPVAAIDTLYIMAPAFSAFTALAAFSVIPFGEGWQIWHYHVNGEVADVPISLILIFALGSLGIYGFIVGGWASESKYSLLGSMRTCAQMVSYEVSLALSVLGVVLMAHTLSISAIVDRQVATWWYAGPQFVGLLCFFIAGIAETNRPPFDLPEADTELVGGYHTEYSGMRWGLFQMAEYVNVIVLSALAVTLYFGGWEGPWAPLGPLWFFIKLLIAVSVFIWLRATLPRLRYDQLMRFGWKVLLPVATVNAVITALFVVIF